jgi:hypothetical protein
MSSHRVNRRFGSKLQPQQAADGVMATPRTQAMKKEMLSGFQSPSLETKGLSAQEELDVVYKALAERESDLQVAAQIGKYCVHGVRWVGLHDSLCLRSCKSSF